MDYAVEPVFVFESVPPWHVIVYASLADAAGTVESLDVDDRTEAYTVTGRVVTVAATSDLFASLQITDESDLQRLRMLLRRPPGPADLAERPSDYAVEWLRRDEIGARRPPFAPTPMDRRGAAE